MELRLESDSSMSLPCDSVSREQQSVLQRSQIQLISHSHSKIQSGKPSCQLPFFQVFLRWSSFHSVMSSHPKSRKRCWCKISCGKVLTRTAWYHHYKRMRETCRASGIMPSEDEDATMTDSQMGADVESGTVIEHFIFQFIQI